MTDITCRLTANNRDQLRNNRVWATFLTCVAELRQSVRDAGRNDGDSDEGRGVPRQQAVVPGAAPSWTHVDNADEEQTTSKSTDVIVVTSPVRTRAYAGTKVCRYNCKFGAGSLGWLFRTLKRARAHTHTHTHTHI